MLRDHRHTRDGGLPERLQQPIDAARWRFGVTQTWQILPNAGIVLQLERDIISSNLPLYAYTNTSVLIGPQNPVLAAAGRLRGGLDDGDRPVSASAKGGAQVALLVGAGLASPAAFGQQRVGVNAAVNPGGHGHPSGVRDRDGSCSGREVVFNERITTGSEGQTQVLFVDQSTMTVGAEL